MTGGPRGLIFDCDGVLVDSETLAAAELVALFARMGVTMTAQQLYRDFLGRSIQTIVDTAARDYALDLAPELPCFTARLATRFGHELRPVPGMAEVIAALPGARAVASSSAPDRLALSLRVTGLAPLFGDHVYSATQVAHGKPAPDLFLLAAARLGLAPEDCVVIEDSPAGIRAAQAAGMRVLGFLGGAHAGPAELARHLAALQPDALVERAADLPNTLAQLG